MSLSQIVRLTGSRAFGARKPSIFWSLSKDKTGSGRDFFERCEVSKRALNKLDHDPDCKPLEADADPGSNKAAQHQCLQVPIDASHINFIATANSIDLLPWPLPNRFRIIDFPEPTVEHLDALIQPLMAEMATRRSLHPRFIAPRTSEDHAFLGCRWRGGSVKRLSRLIDAVVNARERAMLKH